MVGVDPSMALAGTSVEMFEPIEASALSNYHTDEYSEVTVDLRGRNRGTEKIPGASQLTGTVTREMPTKTSAGSDYYVPTPVRVRKVKQSDTEFVAYAANHEIYTNVSEPGILSLYDLSGRCLHKQNMVTGSNVTSLSAKGIFILRFCTSGGEVLQKKIFSY